MLYHLLFNNNYHDWLKVCEAYVFNNIEPQVSNFALFLSTRQYKTPEELTSGWWVGGELTRRPLIPSFYNRYLATPFKQSVPGNTTIGTWQHLLHNRYRATLQSVPGNIFYTIGTWQHLINNRYLALLQSVPGNIFYTICTWQHRFYNRYLATPF